MLVFFWAFEQVYNTNKEFKFVFCNHATLSADPIQPYISLTERQTVGLIETPGQKNCRSS